MRINTNIAALNSYNQLSNTNNKLSKSLERLSSGKRINGAADDAAGLAISEKMGSQTRGLAMAQRNAQDGISMIQTAEGALKESHSILQRMRELSVQSANDTNTKEDRAEIQKEVDQLAEELTRIGDTTEFNTQNLLDGTLDSTKFHIGANEGQNMDIAINDMRADALGVVSEGGAEVDTAGAFANVAGEEDLGAISDMVEYSDIEADAKFTATLEANSVESVEVGSGTDQVEAEYALFNEAGDVVAVSEDGNSYSMLEEATAVEDLDTTTTFASDSTDAVATLSFDNRVVSGEVNASLTTSVAAASDSITATNSSDVTSDSDLAVGKYQVIDVTDADGNAVTVSGSAGGDSDVAATHAMADSDGNIVAVSADGETYSLLDEAVTDVSSGKVAGTDTAGETYDLNFGENAGEGFIDVTGISGAEVTATVYNIASNEVSLEATANIEMSEDNQLESGTYTVVDSTHNSVNDSDLGLVDSDGELASVSSDGQTWNSLAGEEIFSIADASNALETGEEIDIAADGGIDVSSQTAANNAIETLDNAIANVSSERSKLGSVQNRLDHTINNLNTAEENLTAAESRISDVDMAKEMMNMSKQQILSQAGTAMMAQANQLPQGVLQLLG